jgi:DNA polymerase I
MKNTLLAIDGNSLLYRAFYALPLMENSKGDFTNAIYGFFTMLFPAIEKVKPTHMVVAFDKKGKVFRHEKYPEYKGGRKPTPEELVFQFPLLKSAFDQIGIAYMEYDGYEADDILGSFAKYCDTHGDDAYILSGDRDVLQLISTHTKVFLTKKGVSQSLIVDKEALFEMYQMTPSQMVDMKGLMGDASDNIPGVKGVGEKTAIKLLSEYQTLENIYENIADIKGALQQKLISDKESAFLSKELGRIYIDLDVAHDLSKFVMPSLDGKTLSPVFKQFEFKSLLKRYGDEEEKIVAVEPIVIDNRSDFEKLTSKIDASDHFSIVLEDSLYISIDDKCEYKIVFEHSLLSTEFTIDTVLSGLKGYFENSSIKKIVYDGKALMHRLNKSEIALKGIVFDVKLAAYVLDPTQKSFEIDSVADGYGKSGKSLFLYQIWKKQKKELEEKQLSFIYYDVELPLMDVLFDMELTGISVDQGILKKLKIDFEGRIASLIDQIYSLTGFDDFNINSTKQLGEVLFERLKLPIQKKTKTGYSTNIDVLEKLEPYHACITKIIDYRKITKLKSTYIDGLLGLVDAGGKLHSTFNQISTATGRISSVEPNLQNIPIRTQEGREIRKVFIPSKSDGVLVAADYSQIELRVLADIADDKNMKDAFLKNQDIHTRTASQVFDVPLGEVTPRLRGDAKAVNFGIVYGISGFGLAKNLNISVNRASAYIEKYLEEFDGIAKYMKEIKAKASKDGYVTTKFGRIRYIRELASRNFNIRSFGERAALNTPIQGTAADVIKIAMVKVFKHLKDSGLKSKLVLQVHDELIVDTVLGEEEKVKTMLKDIMEDIFKSDVPLLVNVSSGKTWYEAK